jgi:hydrogenase expression/formation protein HypE
MVPPQDTTTNEAPALALECPVPHSHTHIQLAHGGGGRLMHQLLERIFYPLLEHPLQERHADAATLPALDGRPVLTTDAFVVDPLEFPGGDIGKLAVYGTINDLATALAQPLYLTASFVLEEGLELDLLERVVRSMANAARASGVPIVTGDTKVVERGHGSGIFITTTGLGRALSSSPPGPLALRPGQCLLVNGDIGRHAIAVLSRRKGLGFEAPIVSDCENLWPEVHALLSAGLHPACLRDITRGGLASALCELAQVSGHRLLVDEAAIPVSEVVREASELLGLSPLYLACEGRFLAALPQDEAERALAALRTAGASGPAIVGRVEAASRGHAALRGPFGLERPLEMLSGEQLPRIC